MTPAVLILLVHLIAILIFWSGLFSGLETALFSLKSHQLRRLEEKHPSLKQFIRVFRENPRRVLNVLLLGDALFHGHYWIAAFVLTVILGGVGFYLLKRGTALLSPKNIKPEQTLSTLRRHKDG